MKKTVFVIIIGLFCMTSHAREGMFPISEIPNLDLKKAGFEIEKDEIYNPENTSLLDAIVKVNGCTGSFVSSQGLILTNHHCAYGAIRRASTPEHDYLADGFYALTRDKEIPAPGFRVRITRSYEDVSDRILSAIKESMSWGERSEVIKKQINIIETQAEKEHPGWRAEVSEMFSGKTYLLFMYEMLNDVRLVYAPPRSVGEFGGEIDNWMWPRHTGDFSFMRVYVAPDGSPAEYDPENVPYEPKRFARISSQGVQQEDLVFLLGYPGRTYRHRTSSFVAYEQELRMPAVAELYDWQIDFMDSLSMESRKLALKHASRIKGRANTMKNYRGKLLGLERLDLVEKKRAEEKLLKAFIASDPQWQEDQGLLEKIEAIYNEKQDYFQFDFILSYLPRSSTLFSIARTLHTAAQERQKPDDERKSAYTDRRYNETIDNLVLRLKTVHLPTEKAFLQHILTRVTNLPDSLRPKRLNTLRHSPRPKQKLHALVDSLLKHTELHQEPRVREWSALPPKAFKSSRDAMIDFYVDLYPLYEKLEKIENAHSGALDAYYAQLLDVQMAYQDQRFIPDANGTLRLTYGHIRSYSPRDAVHYHPISTLQGIMEKTTGLEPFDTPSRLLDLIDIADYGRFEHKALNSVPVCILYDTDTTGGNSGSPVFNARGELVGLNFDRAFEATINDFAWSADYSRSIGVDVRYILWFMQSYSHAHRLLQEMEIPSGS